jgi:hypothetical protein
MSRKKKTRFVDSKTMVNIKTFALDGLVCLGVE